MRVLQIVTVFSPDGAYGGPTRVATNQCRQLSAEGHDVTLAAGAIGYKGSIPERQDGVPVKLFLVRSLVKVLGFSGLTSRHMRRWLQQQMHDVDVVHIHMGRDLVTLLAARMARRAGVPYLIQTHGMVGPTNHPLAPFIDRFLTIPNLRAAERVFFLTEEEEGALKAVTGSPLRLEKLQNGVPESPETVDSDAGANEIDARGQFEFLFLSRLHKRKRPLMFAAMAKALADDFPDVKFTLVGPDEGEGRKVQDIIEREDAALHWEGPLSPEETTARIKRASVFVLPSVHEPFPMAVLEAMALGKAVIISDTCGLADVVERSEAGIVVDSSLESLVAAARRFLTDKSMLQRAGANARETARTHFGMHAIAMQLEGAYHAAADHRD